MRSGPGNLGPAARVSPEHVTPLLVFGLGHLLVALVGRLVGINTTIVAPSGNEVGIGFTNLR